MNAQVLAKAEIGKNDDLVQGLAENLAFAARTIKTYGEPIERDGATVIPVSKVTYGFGGGSGKEKEPDGETESGGGGGGGLVSSPIGYIEMKNGETKFKPIFDTAILIPLVATGSMTLMALIWGIGKIIKTIGKRE